MNNKKKYVISIHSCVELVPINLQIE
jgi:hypothetical protein